MAIHLKKKNTIHNFKLLFNGKLYRMLSPFFYKRNIPQSVINCCINDDVAKMLKYLKLECQGMEQAFLVLTHDLINTIFFLVIKG